MSKKILYLFFFPLIFFGSCNDENNNSTKDYKVILENLSNNVILATYKDLHQSTVILVQTCEYLKNNKTESSLDSIRSSWRIARVPWEQSEGFLFGPVDQQGIDPSIDSWPVNKPDLEAVLSSKNILTKEYIDGLDGTLKGFHTIEYLIFGEGSIKKVQEFTDREFEYLISCAQSLEGATQQLLNAWAPEKQNFIKNIVNAGEPGNSFYPSQKAALQEIVNGMIVIADEVANGKINDPLSQQNTNLEESRFSANSKRDFSDNIRSIQHLYDGVYKQNGAQGINIIVLENNPGLHSKITTQIAEAIHAIENIPGTFTQAIIQNPNEVINAQNKVRLLQLTLESELLPIILNL